MKQINFSNEIVSKSIGTFGGELNRGRRKARRPLSSKHATHLVLKADTLKSGSLLRSKNQIINLQKKYASSFGIQVYRMAVVGNHLHLVLRFLTREDYRAFIRTFTAQLSLRFKIKWRLRPFTRVLSWGRDFKKALSYVLQNTLEAEGLIAYQPRRIRQKCV